MIKNDEKMIKEIINQYEYDTDVHVNKEIYQSKQYRYLGGIQRYNVKKNKDYIQYYRAWNASFNYKGFNLDMNNDVPFECVPSALFNTYGIKKDNSLLIKYFTFFDFLSLFPEMKVLFIR